MAKQITAAAVLLLAGEGRLSLDDDVRAHVPELPAYAAPITLRHLLHHTSGLRDWGAVAALGGWPRGTRAYTHAHVLDIARRQRELNHPPGRYFAYTNTGYSLLAMVVERAGGAMLPELTRARLFEPLGMASTSWRDDYTRVVKGRAVAYRPAGGGEFRMDMPFESTFGHAGLLTTTGDLLRWSESLRTGRVGGAALVREMHRRGRLGDGREIQYAGGLFVARRRGFPEVHHGGGTAGYRAALVRYPEQRLAVAVLCNAAPADATALARRVADVYLDPAPEPEPPPLTLEPALLEARAGLYRETRTGLAVRLVVRGGALAAVGRGPLTPASPLRFRAGDAWVEFGERPATAFRVVELDGESATYEPVADFVPTAAQLAAFAGTYHSDEADATLTLHAADGALAMRGPGGSSTPLEPAYADAFSAGDGVVRFARGRGGRVMGLTVASERVWSMRFARR